MRKAGENEMIIAALSLMEQRDEPIGAGLLLNVFAEKGIVMGEATAGRFLRRLDKNGWTVAHGKRGRTLTASGKQHLTELRLSQKLAQDGAQFVASIKATADDDLLDLLFARRGIEAQAAYLAALRATPDEIARMEAASCSCAGTTPQQRLGNSQGFHLALAQASHNAVLGAVASMLLDPQNDPLAKLRFKHLAQRDGRDATLADDHTMILDAVRARDPQRAERLMREHIDRLIDVSRQGMVLP